ncbi:hypothetical protein ACFQAT_28610 [Undibacterium arcticum]|uniref:Uncharacterized protein n=1 Tax=Undibacterium arcticum TaxID=1762892 RepID=A0ABV7F9M1_9BURK
MANIHQVWSQELDNGTTGTFGIDDGGRVYWNGNPLVTEERVKLQGWVNAAIFIAAVAAVPQAIFAVLTYYNK